MKHDCLSTKTVRVVNLNETHVKDSKLQDSIDFISISLPYLPPCPEPVRGSVTK